MATKKVAPPIWGGIPVDSRGNVRVYADVPRDIAQEFTIMCVRRNTSKRAMIAQLITNALKGK